jgi:Ca2+-binding EF-hand superfamily protein
MTQDTVTAMGGALMQQLTMFVDEDDDDGMDAAAIVNLYTDMLVPPLTEGINKMLSELIDSVDELSSALFEAMDTNHDGKVDLEEFRTTFYDKMEIVLQTEQRNAAMLQELEPYIEKIAGVLLRGSPLTEELREELQLVQKQRMQGATNKKNLIAFYQRYDPSKTEANVEAMLGKYSSCVPNLVEALRAKYGEAPLLRGQILLPGTTNSFAVTCPPGCGPGDPVQVQIPDGRAMQVNIPAGVMPGQQFMVAY